MYPSHSITILIIHAAASSFCLDLSSNMLRLRARSQSLAVKPAALRSTARPQGPKAQVQWVPREWNKTYQDIH